ncbi:mannose-1-phosphate guanylyltransferase/mannose-6-phosphate isomerase [Vibrio nigripulchritudo]|uniref:mannose-1-phosphate guanylyltransferase/mannose-6-phosphate isomerase n=1 Tax=Vibrio nigripulchritudo TaxID=28173 RepID=UPI0005FA45F7|nr:mannose-1-phosphate guanylyltransferase/mannose-6-phosphate isomerase [Vibrio nigripulchritudo]KJY79057.1 mannose-1-phosphate guanyltransferase [Vibrio nigripulchritudo]
MILPVILSGGTGTRLWPLSRKNFPKQFMSLTSERSLLQETLLRLESLQVSAPILVCNEEHRFIATEQLRQINVVNSEVILEPCGKNTAPALALAAFHAIRTGDDPILLVLPADHSISDSSGFCSVISEALRSAEEGKLVTFGIVPNKAETGFGYIRRGGIRDTGYEVSGFTEKPDFKTASEYLESGEYYWNSGMFLVKASKYLKELESFRPDIYLSCQNALKNGHKDLDFLRVDVEEFSKCPEDSIDYAVMEKTEDAVVYPINVGWSDIGEFSALFEISEKDSNGNVLHGDVMVYDTNSTLVEANGKLVAAVGVSNLIIVNSKDALLVADKRYAQDVKTVVDDLKSKERQEVESHREVYRPWGSYDSLDQGNRFQVKRIKVNPGAKLSVQMHHHRAEHWIVVTGTAKVTVGDKELLLTENQSTYIPVGEVHALENPGKVTLELIEVQSGSYLGEDDIVRFEDRYGRAEN